MANITSQLKVTELGQWEREDNIHLANYHLSNLDNNS